MTPFLLGLVLAFAFVGLVTVLVVGFGLGSWLTVSALAWCLLALGDEGRRWWRVWVAAAAPVLVAWTVAGWVIEWGRERATKEPGR